MQYAGILMEARRYPQAIALYNQLVSGDPSNISAWMGLISAQHEPDASVPATSSKSDGWRVEIHCGLRHCLADIVYPPERQTAVLAEN